MIRNILLIAVLGLAACNNDKKETPETPVTESADNTQRKADKPRETAETTGKGSVTFEVDGTTKVVGASPLVQKDKDKLSPGNEYLAIVTANGENRESFNLNFLFTLKTGTYPVVGLSFNRGSGDDIQVFGGILGGKPKITPYKVNITSCEKLAPNVHGGNKWKISGSVDGPVQIDALGIVKLAKNQPASITIRNIQFNNLTFDDNWDEIMEKTKKMLKK